MKVHAGHGTSTQHREEPAPNYCADDAQYDVKKNSFAAMIDDFAANEAGD
jgi:hypothetical protein